MLPCEVDVAAFFEDRGDLAETVTRDRAGHLQPLDPGKPGLDGEGHLRLHLRGREGRRAGVDLHLRVGDVRHRIDRKAQKVHGAVDRCEDGEDDDRPAEPHGNVEDGPDQTVAMAARIAVGIHGGLVLGLSDHGSRLPSRVRP